jgi:thiol oxidase
MVFGKPSALAWGERISKVKSIEKDEDIEEIPPHMNAHSLLDWINKRLKASYYLDPDMQKKQQSEQSSGSPLGQKGSMSIMHDIEEATAEAYGIILDNRLVTSSHRGPFIQFLQLLAAHHPSKSCQAGSSQILSKVRDIWPSEEPSVKTAGHLKQMGAELGDPNSGVVALLREQHICGEGLPSKSYKTCNMATGGYSCGLWYLFHALSVRVDDSESNVAMNSIRSFVANFYTCGECRQHFLKMSENAVSSISSRRDLTIWFWRAHNEVNDRLGKAETQSSKIQWPPKALCAECSTGPGRNPDEHIDWNEEEVYKFIEKTYGQSIERATHGMKASGGMVAGADYAEEERTITSATTAPIGAALGIAMACFGFGVAAYLWRDQQKRKRNHLHKV